VIVQDGDGAELMRTAAKLRAAIGAVDWNVLSAAPVTLSLGYATWEHVDGWKDIVVAADIALRASKDAGKNAVTSAPQDAEPRRVPRIGPDQALAG
jgi:PleD family two-component response regulator